MQTFDFIHPNLPSNNVSNIAYIEEYNVDVPITKVLIQICPSRPVNP